jgi:hypothetical protein
MIAQRDKKKFYNFMLLVGGLDPQEKKVSSDRELKSNRDKLADGWSLQVGQIDPANLRRPGQV